MEHRAGNIVLLRASLQRVDGMQRTADTGENLPAPQTHKLRWISPLANGHRSSVKPTNCTAVHRSAAIQTCNLRIMVTDNVAGATLVQPFSIVTAANSPSLRQPGDTARQGLLLLHAATTDSERANSYMHDRTVTPAQARSRRYTVYPPQLHRFTIHTGAGCRHAS